MAARRVTRAKIDNLAELHAQMKEIEAQYDAEIERLKMGGAATYDGNVASLVITQQSRSVTDWERLRKRYKIPAQAVARATRERPFLRADIVRRNPS